MPATTRRRVDLRRETRLAALLHHFDRHRRTLDIQSTLGIAELRLLWLLTDGQARTLREISEELRLEQSTVNRQVNGALNSGLLRRSRPSGSTPFVFEATEDGRATFEHETALALTIYGQVLDAMGEDRATQLLELFDEFVTLYGDAVDEVDSGRTVWPG